MSASAPSGVLPEDAKLVVTPIVNDGNDSLYEDTSDRLKEQAEKDKQTVDAFIAYDIQFEKDGKEVEPDDGKVTVTMKWDSAVKPEGVQGDEKISVVHLKDEKTVENLSKEKDADKNHASVETDDKDSEALTKAEITSDSFSVYAVEWTIDNVSSITVHYTDENGNEISPADTVDAPADAGADTLAKAIDGYTYASATVDQTNATELKTENGRLSFNDGTNWNQASSKDVYLTYTAVPAEETVAPEESTEAPTETTEPEATSTPEETAEPENSTGVSTPAPETTSSSDPSVTEDSETTLNAATKDNKYNVTVTYGKDAGLPDGTKLTVKTISSDNDEYENAKNAVAASRKVDADSLGMTALDITLTDKDGKKVEPKDHSKVKVSINAVGLPSEAESIDIHHITETNTESSNPVSNALNSIVRFSKKVFTGTTDQAEEVKKNVAVTDGQAVADFEVSSFSTFTITWTTSKSTSTSTHNVRFANVNVHYVNEKGSDVTDPTSVPTNTFGDDGKGIVKLSNWANEDNGDSRVSGYDFIEARIGSRDGKVITGLRGIKSTADNKDTYQLQYTTDTEVSESSKWILYTDSVSGTSDNNADVYLIFKKSAVKPITIHYVTADGQAIKDANGNAITKIVDADTWADDAKTWNVIYGLGDNITGYVKDTTYNSGSGLIVGKNGSTLTFPEKVINTSGSTWEIQDSNKQSIGTITGGYIFRFIRYQTRNGERTIQLGTGENLSTLNQLNTKTVTNNAGDNDHVNRAWVVSGDFDIYLRYAIADNISVTVHHVDANGNKLADDTTVSEANAGTLTADSIKTNISGYSIDKAYYGRTANNNTGTEISTLTYNKGTYQWTTANGVTNTENPVTEVWAVYQADNTLPVTIHHVDSATGKLIAPDTSKTISATNTVISPSDSDNNVSGYTTGSMYYGWTSSSSKGTAITSMTYNLNDDNWTSLAKTEGDTTGSNTAALQNELWVEYTRTNPNQIVIHHVDENGTPIAANTVTNNIVSSTTYNGKYDGYTMNLDKDAGTYRVSVEGYTYVGEYVGDISDTYEVPSGHKVMYHYETNGWQTGQGTGTLQSGFTKLYDSLVTDVYHVYKNNNATNRFTVHYKYIGTDNTVGDTTTADKTFTLTEDHPSQDLQRGDANLANDLVPNNAYKADNTPLVYMSTRLGSVGGPEVKEVMLNNGEVQFYDRLQLTLTRQTGTTRWLCNDSSGRQFVLTYDSSTGNYTLTDSQHGSIEMNLDQSSTGAADFSADQSRVWTATYHGEKQTTKYSITPTQAGERQLVIEDWTPNATRDIYVLYIDDDTTNGKIWINDNLKYTGYFEANISDSLKSDKPYKDIVYNTEDPDHLITSQKLDGIISNRKYTWYRKIGDGQWTEVTRKRDYSHWNMEYDAKDRKWLDVEADEGTDVWRAGSTIQYKVVLSYTYTPVSNYSWNAGTQQETYTQGTPETRTVESVPVAVNYYGQLENGDFETPTYTKPINQLTNADYAAKGSDGVWQSTGVGTESGGTPNASIEIINTTAKGNDGKDFTSSYAWKDETPRYKKDEHGNDLLDSSGNKIRQYAVDGDQFAELNCSAAGALYQDVITHPNEELSYWFSHRARGQQQNTFGEVDTMYLVIMPTNLAMISGSDGGELKTQSDLIDFIDAHGGFSYDEAHSEDDKVTYANEQSGILIRRVSSDDRDWHSINATNGYIAKGGLTRFFFVAGPTSWSGENGSKKAVENATHGNFLDAVGFSQSPRTPNGFSLTIQKTFTNLTPAQVATMADNFKITLSDKHINTTSAQEEDANANTALNGAELRFTYTEVGGVYTFTPTAKLGEKNLLTDNSSATARTVNGNVVMTWTLDDQKLDSEDQYYNYKATESGATVDGYRVSENDTVSPAAVADPNAVTVSEGETARIAINNTYTPHGETEQPQVTIRKVFAGVTPQQVDALFTNGYTITVTGPNENGNQTSYVLSTNTDQMSGEITLEEERNADGSTVLKWTIPGMKDGDYSITETGLEANQNDNKLTKVTVNGTEVNIPDNLTNSTQIQKTSISVGTASNLINFGSNNDKTAITVNQSYTLSEGINMIIARYHVNVTSTEGSSTTTYKYLVWTSESLGRNSTKAILTKIKDLWSLNTEPSESDVYYRSGGNPGGMTMTLDGGARVKATYDSQSRALTFAEPSSVPSGSTITWDDYHATTYSINSGLGKEYGWLDDSDITIENIYNPVVKIQKVSEDGTSLGGAQFRLYKLNGDAKEYYQESGSTAAKPDWGSASGAKTFTTASQSSDSTTLGTIEIGALEKASGDTPDTYYLEEVKAPDGYNKLAKPISFTVDKEGTIELSDASTSVDNSKATVDYQSDARYYVIRVSNTPGVLLPITGGIGVWPFIFTGFALIMFASYLLWRRRRSKLVEEKLMDEIRRGGDRW